jgi:ribosomal protein L11 methyltransferase
MSDLLHVVTLTTDVDTGSVINEMLPSIGLSPTSYFGRDDRIAHLNLYYEERSEALVVQTQLLQALAQWQEFCGFTMDQVEVLVHEIKKEDWSESWKAFFHVFRASDRLVVKPSWEDYEAGEGDLIIEIDPGMSFGTGNHGTTQACLQFLDESMQDGKMSFIDMGSGSGILSMGAYKLGYGPIEAFDYDPDAVRIAAENLELSNCPGVKVYQQDLSEYEADKTFDVVAANILAPVLLANAHRIVAALKVAASSRLILSGILHEQYSEIRTGFEKMGLRELQCKKLGDWSSGLFGFPS